MMVTADRLHSVQEYYFSKKLREVRGLMNQGKPIINMGIGSPDLPPSKEAVTTLQEVLEDSKAHQYQSYQGLPELREAMANFYASRFKVHVDANTELLPLMGSKEGIMHISLAFLNVGDEVLIPNPGYPTYSSVTNLIGAKPVMYDLTAKNGWLPDIKALEKTDLSKVKLMWISYPNMPTGAKIDRLKMKELVAFAKANDLLIVNDNPYSFVLNDNPTSILQVEGAKEVALELNSLSKTFNMAGWRVGMVLGNSEHVTAVLKVKSNMDSGMFYGIQKGAITALESGGDWFEKLDEVYRKRRKLMFQLVDKFGATYDKDAAGMFIWAKLPEGSKSSEDFIDEVLYDKDVFIAPGTIFGSNGEGYIRFSLCVEEEKIKEAIRRFE
ncbi:aminotransferase class I/II-fold pyridoxal phosphate-dependent enzyme [Flagellimonas sp. HMM57]|uniref:pyridoxal phosphate-dependent aminotransferase n=1 Tax=unclassified Flagellimonas TaxID=2644544 RepID=UPI0013D1A0E1|nr:MULTISPECIES: aminotransferase class I/II-fold pyridoxal phosphate-dependent enzyme [unclassified Flagellimonas]UII77945.1 aminotransferase class I/II-fold pyridoxal phosphate-dependent enzyme [Flagellimonas sp. HMM57]